MKVAKEVSRSDIRHNMLYGGKSSLYMRCVVHRQENSGDELKRKK
jgi:hypothetical protein